ncbi:MAG: RNA polymerase factor sigma-32 [Alphaproteobacteria bacterium]|nr:RNA polymerase factor sigma-32 [Alphaproteobacteria bacterium]|tara:strand:+ start:1178 stop:2029 length:852 start_codon:yes stop_codon:yes gene_type:complete
MALPTFDTSLSTYLREIQRYPLLSLEAEQDLARRWRDKNDSAAFEQLIGSHLRLVVKMAKKAGGYGLQMADLIAEGNIGLIDAARKFDPDHGNRFSTYAIWWIRAAIQRYVLGNSSVVRLGTTAGQKKLFFNLRRLKGELGEFDDDNISGEAVTSIAERLGVHADEIIDMNGRLSRNDYSLNATVAQDGEMKWQDTLVDESVDVEADLVGRDELHHHRVYLQRGLSELNERERDILVRRRLTEDRKTLADLSEEYGVSRERIRQIEVAAFNKLKKSVRGQKDQ